MVKFYTLYLLIGGYFFFESFIVWAFSFGGADAITYMALLSSVMLCPIASGLILVNIRIAVIIGLIGLAGVFPFGIHWLLYCYKSDYFYTIDLQNSIICIAVVLYVVSLIYTIKALINYKLLQTGSFKKTTKLFLASISVTLLLLEVVMLVLGY